MTEALWGLVALGLPAILIGAIVLGRSRPVLFMYVAAVAVGLGYLYTTGAVDDIGKQVMEYLATEPATETAPASGTPSGTAPAAP